MKYNVAVKVNGEIRLAEYTTEHSASSYGQPVLVFDGQAYGSGDLELNKIKVMDNDEGRAWRFKRALQEFDKAGLSQIEIAKMVGVTPVYISQVKNGKRQPSEVLVCAMESRRRVEELEEELQRLEA